LLDSPLAGTEAADILEREAFADNYLNFCDTIRARAARRKPSALELDFPDVTAGVRGMRFVEAVVASQKNGNRWTKV